MAATTKPSLARRNAGQTHGVGEVEALEGDKVVVALPTGRSRKFKREFLEPAEQLA